VRFKVFFVEDLCEIILAHVK